MLTTNSRLGLGAGHIGSPDVLEEQVRKLLAELATIGVSFVDTARGYNLSEGRLGDWNRSGGTAFTIVSKCGYDVPGYENWTPECIIAGVDLALKTLGLNELDGMLLHSCDQDTLSQSGVLQALAEAKKAGKVKNIGYSGENEALAFAVGTGLCDFIETSVNIVDQWSLRNVLPDFKGFVIAKRPICNAPWAYSQLPVGQYAEEYWRRWHRIGFDDLLERYSLTPLDLALRFSAHAQGVSVAILGTKNVENLRAGAAVVQKGPLPNELLAEIDRRYSATGADWPGQI